MSTGLDTSLRIINRNIRDSGSPLTIELDKDGKGYRPSINGHFIAPRMSAKECERFLDGASSMLAALRLLSPNEDTRDARAAREAREVLWPNGNRSNEFTPQDLERVAEIIR